jgi:hypothetical protein
MERRGRGPRLMVDDVDVPSWAFSITPTSVPIG